VLEFSGKEEGAFRSFRDDIIPTGREMRGGTEVEKVKEGTSTHSLRGGCNQAGAPNFRAQSKGLTVHITHVRHGSHNGRR